MGAVGQGRLGAFNGGATDFKKCCHWRDYCRVFACKRHKVKKDTGFFADKKLMPIFATLDSLAQQVEHNTFNVGVLGSSPKRITIKEKDFLPKSFSLIKYLS